MSDEADQNGSDDAVARLQDETAEARRLLKHAEVVLQDTLGLFDILRDEIREGTAPKDFNDGMKLVTRATLSLHEELKKYEKCVLTNEGLVADAPLDLDAIRAEIGGRLDRLRATK